VAKVRSCLFSQEILPLPFAASLPQLRTLLHTLRTDGEQPGVFIINTFGVEDMLRELDILMADTPVLFFRREMMWLKRNGQANEGPGLTTCLKRMRPRLTAIWYYGSANYEDVAARAANRLNQFLRFNDFSALEGSIRLDEVTANRMRADSRFVDPPLAPNRH
jgi:hypothetical protein